MFVPCRLHTTASNGTKQSRMEKLLRYLNDNDADKWQKNREKLDDETKAYYAEDLSLMDVLNDLWNGQSEQATTLYFGCYEKSRQNNFPGICEGERFRFLRYGTKADQSIINLLEASKIKFLSAGHCWTAFTPPNIRLTPPCCNGCRTSARWRCWKECSKPHSHHLPDLRQGYPNGKFIAQVNASENVRLYQLGEDHPDSCKLQSLL